MTAASREATQPTKCWLVVWDPYPLRNRLRGTRGAVLDEGDAGFQHERFASLREAMHRYSQLGYLVPRQIFDPTGGLYEGKRPPMCSSAHYRRLLQYVQDELSGAKGDGPPEPPSWGWPERKELMEVGAYVFLWIGGIYITILLMQKFEFSLKPLLLAAVFVSALEVLVQTNEWVLWKLLVFCAYFLKCVHLSIPLLWRACRKQDASDIWDDVKDWRRLWHRWDASFAGKNILIRIVAVLFAVGVVLLVGWGVESLCRASIHDFIQGASPDEDSRIKAYGKAITGIAADVKVNAESIASWLDVELHTNGSFKSQLDRAFSGNMEQYQDEVQDFASSTLSGLLSSTRDFVFQLVFFILYALLWLMVPLTITLGSEEQHFEQEEQVNRIYSIGSCLFRERSREVHHDRSRRPLLASEPELPLLDPRWHIGGAGRSDIRSLDAVITDFAKRTKEESKRAVHSHLNEIIQVFFALKAFVNALTAVCFFTLLYSLKVDLAPLLALLTFFLGFIPEIGFIAQFFLSLPLVVLSPANQDGVILAADIRANFVGFCIGSGAIKLVVNNVIESAIMSTNKSLNVGGEEVHPVVVLLAVAVSSEIWGCVGMLLAVPAISLIRLVFHLWSLPTPSEGDCFNCGNKVSSGMTNCPHCGVKLGKSVPLKKNPVEGAHPEFIPESHKYDAQTGEVLEGPSGA